MRKKICYIVAMILVAMVILNLGTVYGAESTNKTASVGIIDSNEDFLLEELIKNEEEQEQIRKNVNEISLEEIKEQEKIKESTLSIKSNIDCKVPINSTCLEGVVGNGCNWYVETYNSTTSYFAIHKHDIMKNKNNEIFRSASSDNASYITYHLRDNILYILYIMNYDINAAWLTEYSTSYVIGIDINTDEIVYNGAFDTPQNCGYLPSFAVDGEQRFYFVYKSTGMRTFDKNGNLLYEHSPLESDDDKYLIYIKGVSPNNRAIFFETMYNVWEGYSYYQSVYEGIQKLNDGVFVYKDAYTVYGRTYPSVFSHNPRWYFLDSDGIFAADQYGRIAKFSYDVDSDMGVGREIVLNLNSGLVDYTYYEPEYANVCINGNDIFIMGSNNNIYRVSLKDLQTSQYLTTDIENYGSVYTMEYFEDSILLCYYSSRYNIIQISLDSNSYTNITNITYSDHSTTKHSIQDIVSKYKQTAPMYDYNTSIYEEIPSWRNPYSAGSLRKQVITDTLNTLNYNRWLVGVDEISTNDDKMTRNQKGAVISKANGEISHYPSQPSDMTDDFYSEAYDGCNAKAKDGDTYSGNVSYGDKIPYEAIRGFISDINNITYGSATGHRQSMLDPKATATSFGQCEEYTTVSTYYDSEKITKEKYYAFPSAGYFPNTEMAIGEYWSIYINSAVSGTASVKFTYNGKQYNGIGLVFESGYPVLSFKMPEELRKILGDDNSNIPAGTAMQVEVLGLKDENQNEINYKYTVEFFDMKSELPTTSDIENLIFDYKYYADQYADLKNTFGYNATALKQHWLTSGIAEGRQASPLFDLKYYIYNNADVKATYGINYVAAYNHFINNGWHESRPTSGEFYIEYYKNTYQDLNKLSTYGLMMHYINFGKREGRTATNVIDQTPISIEQYLFNKTVYANLNYDVKEVLGENSLKLNRHWLENGVREGRIASLVFDAKYYLNNYADLKAAFGNNYEKAYEHFVNTGINEGRKGSMFFDVKYYLDNNEDIKVSFGSNYTKALEHFVRYGLNEGRNGSSSFKVNVYINKNKDVFNAFGNNYIQYYLHYIVNGIKENRIAC